MATYTLIASTTLSSTASTITFSSIPNTYTDLVILASVKTNTLSDSDGAYAMLSLNGTSTTNTGSRFCYTNASASSASAGTGYSAPNWVLGWGGGSEGGWSCTTYYIYNYASTPFKSIRSDSWQEAGTQFNCRNGMSAGFFDDSTAINSVTINSVAGSYIAQSTMYLYGISNA
jgi:hypothetical protein